MLWFCHSISSRFPQHDLQFSAIPRLPWCSCLAQGSSLALLGKTAPQLLRSNSLGAVGPEAGARCVGEDWKEAPFGDPKKKLGSFLRHEHVRVSFLLTRNPWFQKMCPDTLAPQIVVFSSRHFRRLGDFRAGIGMGCSGSKTKVQASSTTSKARPSRGRPRFFGCI